MSDLEIWNKKNLTFRPYFHNYETLLCGGFEQATWSSCTPSLLFYERGWLLVPIPHEAQIGIMCMERPNFLVTKC